MSYRNLIVGFVGFVVICGAINWYNAQPAVDKIYAQDVQSAQITPRDNQRMTVQVNDWLAVGAVCADGKPATVDSIYPDAVVFVCGE